jgi:hypothetical protein
MVRRLYVVGNYLDHRFLQDVEYLVALQIQDAPNQDAVRTFQDVHPLHQLVVVVDEELRHLLKMDYYQDVVDGEQNYHQLKTDYYPDEELQVLHLLHLYLPLKFSQLLPVLVQAQHFLREQP